MVGRLADQRRQRNDRDELHQPDQPEIERAAGELVDLPADGDRLHLVGPGRRGARAPIERKGAMLAQARRGGQDGFGGCGHRFGGETGRARGSGAHFLVAS
jgi:hypothetical protein